MESPKEIVHYSCKTNFGGMWQLGEKCIFLFQEVILFHILFKYPTEGGSRGAVDHY